MLTRSMVAASTAPMAHATARSRMRSASTSRRSGSSSLLSLRLRTGRSSERITAPAKTAPNHAPRPTSSTPATAWKPRETEILQLREEARAAQSECDRAKGKLLEAVRNCSHRWGPTLDAHIYHASYIIPGDPPGTRSEER